MKIIAPFVVLFALCSAALSQDPPEPDRIVLTNGDQLTGTIKTMADGKLTIESSVLGDVVVEMGKITSITTVAPVGVLTTTGDLLRRRITGIENGRLMFDGQGSEALGNLDQINPPPEQPPKWTGAIKLGAGYAEGNTDRRNVAASLDAELRRPEDRITIERRDIFTLDLSEADVVLLYLTPELNRRLLPQLPRAHQRYLHQQKQRR